MKISRIQIQNIRCFVNAEIELSPGITVIVGPNNNGKTTLLNCISSMQQPRQIDQRYCRVNSDFGSVRIWFNQSNPISPVDARVDNCYTQTNMGDMQGRVGESHIQNWHGFANTEPNNFIIPFQSKRKVGGYSEGITLGDVNQVNGTLSNLYAKVDRIANPEFQPAYSEYVKACDEILGFRVSTTSSGSGKKAAYVIRNELNIPIDMMGEGVSNLLGLIVDLCRVEGKLFIIEEPENDIHPKALKRLLDLIVEKSDRNQFLVTTHSNIVLRHLGVAPTSKIYNIEMSLTDRVPTSSVNLIDSPEKRRNALEDLGYEFFDYGLWDYWIFFEEASAERVFRDLLIPWFAPALKNKTRTFSARTVNEVALKFEDFNRLFVFLHLQADYKNRVWVAVDAGDNEREIVEELAGKYAASGWERSRFRQFEKHDFEEYYPARFSTKVAEALREPVKKRKMELKSQLLQEVLAFAQTDEKTAKKEFLESANELVDFLKLIKKS